MVKQQRLIMDLLAEVEKKSVVVEESEKAQMEKNSVAEESEKARIEKKSVVEENEKAEVEKNSVVETEESQKAEVEKKSVEADESEKADDEKKSVVVEESEKAEVDKKSVEADESEKAEVEKKSVIGTDSAEPITKEVDVSVGIDSDNAGLCDLDDATFTQAGEIDNNTWNTEESSDCVIDVPNTQAGEIDKDSENTEKLSDCIIDVPDTHAGEKEPSKESGTGKKEPKPGTGEEAPPKELSLPTTWNNRNTITEDMKLLKRALRELPCYDTLLETLKKGIYSFKTSGEKRNMKLGICDAIICHGIGLQTIPLDLQTIPLGLQTIPLYLQTIPLGLQTIPLDLQTIPLSLQTIPLGLQIFNEIRDLQKSLISGVMRGHGGGGMGKRKASPKITSSINKTDLKENSNMEYYPKDMIPSFNPEEGLKYSQWLKVFNQQIKLRNIKQEDALFMIPTLFKGNALEIYATICDEIDTLEDLHSRMMTFFPEFERGLHKKFWQLTKQETQSVRGYYFEKRTGFVLPNLWSTPLNKETEDGITDGGTTLLEEIAPTWPRGGDLSRSSMEMSTPANSTNLAILGLHPSAYKVRRTPVIKTKWDIDGARGSERMWGQQTHGSWGMGKRKASPKITSSINKTDLKENSNMEYYPKDMIPSFNPEEGLKYSQWLKVFNQQIKLRNIKQEDALFMIPTLFKGNALEIYATICDEIDTLEDLHSRMMTFFPEFERGLHKKFWQLTKQETQSVRGYYFEKRTGFVLPNLWSTPLNKETEDGITDGGTTLLEEIAPTWPRGGDLSRSSMEMSTPANSTNLAILGLHPSAYKVRRTPVIKTKWDIDGARGSERMWGQQTHGSWPMEQGVIVAFKRLYKRRQLESCLVFSSDADQPNNSVGEQTFSNLKKYDIKKAIFNFGNSWDELKSSTIRNGWKILLEHKNNSDLETAGDALQLSEDESDEDEQEIRRLEQLFQSARIEVNQESINEWIDIDLDDPGRNVLSNDDIVEAVLREKMEISSSDDSSSTSEDSLEPDVPRCEALKSLDFALKYLEKRTEPEMLASYNTINSLRTMLMREEEALLNKPKKQTTISNFFAKP
ncbi:TIGD7 [Cordylochernes scorpioides]|uniref:TIGD7 n=1 Tax=Cordylochernes scorpioides TaxID=51811 RepID=A0ABY6KDE3_9ARAC|nr:TIGD7 [Cordylochernes scorpioides]